MRQYIIRRALLIIPTILGVTLLASALLSIIPGDIADRIVAESAGYNTSLTKEQVEEDLGVGENFIVQWAEWLSGLVQGDFGHYFRSGRPVQDELVQKAPVTLQLSAMALVVSLLIGLPIGILSAVRQDKPVDYAARSSAIFMLALPTFWLGTMFFVIVGQYAGELLPPLIYRDPWQDPEQNLRMMWAPSLILGLSLAGGIMRLTRGQMLEVMRQDYVRTAWAKGLRERTIITRHALKNAFIPVVTLIGVQVPLLVSGTVVLESIFSLPGLGRMFFEALDQREYLAVLGVLVFVSTVVVISNFLVDVAYSLLDPRVRFA
jgi:peptide/nickel transport system permease protein